MKLILNIVCAVLCLSHIQPLAWAAETDLPAIKVAVSDDQSIISNRILYEGLKRTGHEMVVQVTGMRTSLADVSFGDAAVLPYQTDGWEDHPVYPDLLKVPVAIDNVEFTAYIRSESDHVFSGWDDLSGLRVGYRLQNAYVANKLGQMSADGLFTEDELVMVNTPGEVWTDLLDGRTDVVVLPRMSHYEHRYPQGVKRAEVLERQAVYTYVNKHYQYLIEPLTEAYEEMIETGVMDIIQSGRMQSDKKTILHINSYDTQNEWERGQMEYIRNALERDIPLDYYSVDLSANKRHSRASFNSIVSDIIRTDFIERYPDLIMVSGNEALDFVLNNYYLLFPNVPVVYFGVNGLGDSDLYGYEDYITGISETISFKETVEEMLRLCPGTSRIYILNGYYLSKSGKLREEMQNIIDFGSFPAGLEFEFSENKPFSEILDDIRSFGPDTLVLIGNYISDSDNAFYSEAHVQRSVSAASGSPVFCLTAPYIGQGTFGGLVSGTAAQNDKIVSMAADILTSRLLVRTTGIADPSSFAEWQFDEGVMNRLNIDAKTLPAVHTMINRALPIWETNPLEFNLALTVAILLLLIICGLIVFTRMLSKKQAAAETASVAKSTFLANMSHEIRTPLNAIVGMTSIGMSAADLERMKYCFTKIEDASKHLLGVINDILDMSKIESGKFDLSLDEFIFENMLRRVVDVVNFRVDQNRQKFNVHIDKSIPRNLIGDDQRLAQVITNLLSNAVKFTPEEGEICLDTKLLNEENGICTIQFVVSDTGIGISAEQQARLFKSFQQAQSDTTRKFGGTGLGLSISKNIVEMMGGRIWIESELGKGSRFTFTVRLRRGEDRRYGLLAPNINIGNVRVLAVDDDPDVLVYFKELMHEMEIFCDVVMSGEDALEIVEKNGQYNIYFVDWKMPGMDGMELTKKLKEKADVPGRSVVIMISAAQWSVVEAEARKAGVDKFISKPLFPSALVDAINECLGIDEEQVEDSIASNAGIFTGSYILLAEDVEINREIVIALLEPTGLIIDCAENGAEAVRMFSEAPDKYKMIFMDVQMPEMDGYDATRSIRALGMPRAREIPIIAMTANVFREDVEKCLEAGMNGHVGKPLDLNDVLEQLRRHLI